MCFSAHTIPRASQWHKESQQVGQWLHDAKTHPEIILCVYFLADQLPLPRRHPQLVQEQLNHKMRSESKASYWAAFPFIGNPYRMHTIKPINRNGSSLMVQGQTRMSAAPPLYPRLHVDFPEYPGTKHPPTPRTQQLQASSQISSSRITFYVTLETPRSSALTWTRCSR